MRKKWLIRLMLLAVILVLAIIGLDQRLIVRTYKVQSEKLDKPIRLAVLSDYHGCDYGPDGTDLVQAVSELQPDAILLVGDMFSADGDPEAELRMFRQLDSIAFTYYVTGNHEYWEQDVPALLDLIKGTGVTVPDQSCVSLVVDGQRINLCGIPDPYAYVDTQAALNRTVDDIDHPAFTVLMAHRPELIEKYAATGSFDLVVSGHAHGGQVRIPGIVNGLFAPNQGWFPKYAGGRYDVDGTTLIVSRGLSTQRQMGVPRVFNRPELVVVELVPAK